MKDRIKENGIVYEQAKNSIYNQEEEIVIHKLVLQ